LYASEQKLGRQQYTTTAQISDFLTFWGTRDFIIAVSSQSRGQRIAFVAARATEILPKRAGNHLQAQAVIPSILLRYIYLPIGWSLALTHADNLRGMFSCCKSSRL